MSLCGHLQSNLDDVIVSVLCRKIKINMLRNEKPIKITFNWSTDNKLLTWESKTPITLAEVKPKVLKKGKLVWRAKIDEVTFEMHAKEILVYIKEQNIS